MEAWSYATSGFVNIKTTNAGTPAYMAPGKLKSYCGLGLGVGARAMVRVRAKADVIWYTIYMGILIPLSLVRDTAPLATSCETLAREQHCKPGYSLSYIDTHFRSPHTTELLEGQFNRICWCLRVCHATWRSSLKRFRRSCRLRILGGGCARGRPTYRCH
jgi:hypothetical protein